MAILGGRAGGVNLHFLEGVLRGRDLLVRAANVTDAGLFAVDAVDRITHRPRPLAQNVKSAHWLRAGVVERHADSALLTHWDLQELITGEH